MISITTLNFDLNGVLLLNPDASSELKSNTRRISRTSTLDGGCSISDQGFSDADRTFNIQKKNVSEYIADRIWYLFRTYSLVNVATREGLFKGAIEKVSIVEGDLKFKILIKEKIT